MSLSKLYAVVHAVDKATVDKLVDRCLLAPVKPEPRLCDCGSTGATGTLCRVCGYCFECCDGFQQAAYPNHQHAFTD